MADTFTDNAFVQALGSHLGMTNLLQGDMGTPPGGYGGEGGGPAGAPQITPPKAPPARVEGSNTPREFRQHAPVAKSPAAAKSAGGGLGPGMNLPGVMSPDVLMHPVVQQLLQQYGVDPTSAVQHADPNLFLPKEAIANHPLLGGMIERGLEGLAFTQGGATVGESISNAARGLLNAQAARADKYNNQLMMPFAQAGEVQSLLLKQKQMEYQKAMEERQQALVEHYANLDKVAQERADAYQQHQDDWKAVQDSMRGMRNQIAMLKAPPLDEKGTADLKAVMDKAGGKYESIPEDELARVFGEQAERTRKANEEGKNHRADVMAGARITGDKIRSQSTQSSKGSELHKQNYEALVKQKAAFLKDLNNPNILQAVGPDGNKYRAGKSETLNYLKQLDADIAKEKDAWENDQTMAIPGTMTPTTPGRGGFVYQNGAIVPKRK